MDRFSGFLVYVLLPLVMLYALVMSFISEDLKALLVSAIGTIVIMFLVGRLYQK